MFFKATQCVAENWQMQWKDSLFLFAEKSKRMPLIEDEGPLYSKDD